MVAEPAATPVTRPAVDTIATLASLVDQVMVRPDKVFPAASLGTALKWTVSPGPIVEVWGVTTTEATGGGLDDPGPVVSLLQDSNEATLRMANPAGPTVTPATSNRFISLSPYGIADTTMRVAHSAADTWHTVTSGA